MSGDLGPVRTVTEAAAAVLGSAEPATKAERSRRMASLWRAGELAVENGGPPMPDRPARPERPELLPPGRMPRRRIGRGRAGRFALLHAVAHIEFNAIDLAWDLVGRFADGGLPDRFFADWIAVGDDEARHFMLVESRLRALGGGYGDLPAHDGLWEAAASTADDLLARLAIVPMVLEARGLDVTPDMIRRLDAAGDTGSAAVLRVIYEDEIGHVAAGRHWFEVIAGHRGLPPEETWQALVRERFRGGLKPPFNAEARDRAGFPERFWGPPAAS
ncbi:ferritin-like domain-containing protein [Oceanibacterium hippocampi]|uniref:Rhamnosyltransferase n=1 Tax=Oceanibacterium hippocampi TaxID=745714 RepID=A0A1Y5SWA6_9PROT|nr:ferritin-like domain-containing protein [Oceanibacterium hippocampi]SLN49245.1 hypothetical protein OCH7691_02149 [Oceanibacterium hippocampi]